jgi:hypothetical protein
MERKTVKKLTVYLFAGYIAVFSAWNLFAAKRTFSANENRTLAAAPSLSAKHIFGGSFDTDFETWFSDQFVGRDRWIELKSALRKAGGAIENNAVYFGSDGRLISQFLTCDPGILSQNTDLINSFCTDNGVQGNVLLVPTAAYGESASLPAGAYNVDQQALLDTAEKQLSGQTFLRMDDVLAKGNLYFKTDHHWNEVGAFAGYEAIARTVLNKEPNSFHFEKASSSFEGTMYSKSGAFWTRPDSIYTILPDDPYTVQVTYDDGTETDSLYSESRLQDKDQYAYYEDGNHAYVDIKTSAGSGRKAILVKDSYAHILVPNLASEYSEIIMVDLRYYHAPVSQLLDDKENTDLYFIYSLDNFCTDTNLAFLR